MNNDFPIWLVVIDYIFGFLMFILILKFIFNLFVADGNKFYIVRLFSKITMQLIQISTKITPKFIVEPIIPIFVAWLIFMLRIYFLPLLIGYSSIGDFAFIFEKDIITLISSTILNMALYLNYGIY